MISSMSGPKAGPEVAIGTFTDKTAPNRKVNPKMSDEGTSGAPHSCASTLGRTLGRTLVGTVPSTREMSCGKETVSDRLCVVETETDGTSGDGGWDVAVASRARAFTVIKQLACAGNLPSESLTGFLSLIFPGL